MTNPWLKYDYKANNTVHPLDLELFRKVNQRLSGKKGKTEKTLSSSNVALPYFGNPNANLVLLYANPGLDPQNTKKEETPELKGIFDKARKHQKLGKHDFIFLLDAFKSTPGFDWWTKTLEAVINEPKLDGVNVLNNIFSAEIHPYKSVKYGPLKDAEGAFPSTEYTYLLVRAAMQRNALILIARAEKEWFAAVKGLSTYKNVIYLSSVQQSKISPNNTILDRKALDKDASKKAAWAKLVKALQKAPSPKG